MVLSEIAAVLKNKTAAIVSRVTPSVAIDTPHAHLQQ
jgi:hypothetical protein